MNLKGWRSWAIIDQSKLIVKVNILTLIFLGLQDFYGFCWLIDEEDGVW